VETVDFFLEKITLPFPSPQDLETQAAADLTRGILHAQPAGLLYQVGDAQTIASKRVATIFEGATQRKTKIIAPPTEKEDYNAPPRVCTHVSPPRVSSTTAQNMSPHHKKSPHSIPNSYWRQKTPAIWAVTPQTPYVMVRRSARQQYNLSQDTMAETINQANHCFSILSHKPKQIPKLNRASNEFIIMPEMANDVICPDTGKSLKHNKLITKLKYRIKWMRSTANEIYRLYITNTIRFIQWSNIPKGTKVTYGSFVVDIKDHKEEKERTILTVGGDQIEYPGVKSTRTAGLTTTKILINSVISTLGAKFLVININFFNLNNPLERFEYMVVNLSSLPQETIDKYSLINLAQDGKESKLKKECTGYHKQASSPTNCYSPI
jgi:hypothetical protein